MCENCGKNNNVAKPLTSAPTPERAAMPLRAMGKADDGQMPRKSMFEGPGDMPAPTMNQRAGVAMPARDMND